MIINDFLDHIKLNVINVWFQNWNIEKLKYFNIKILKQWNIYIQLYQYIWTNMSDISY